MRNLLVAGTVVLALSLAAAFYSEQLKDDYINSNRPYVVKLTNAAVTSGGTGFFIEAPSGKIYVMTNGHVCGLAKDKQIFLVHDNYKVPVTVIENYENNDLCLLEAPIGVKSGLKVAASARNTENISVLGHPLLQPKTLAKGQLSGRILVDILHGYDIPCEGKTFHKEEPNDLFAFLSGAKYACIRTTIGDIVTANILPGNSGSPVLNSYGHVVGVAFAGSPGSGRGLIVPLEDVKTLLRGR